MEPAFILTPADEKKLAEAKKPWNLYDSLPHDNHEILEQLSEQDKKAMLPADSAEEYIEDGKPAAQGAPAGNIVDGKYVRPLRDYGYLFDTYRMKITELVDREQSAMRDKQMVEDTLADAKLQVQFWQETGDRSKSHCGRNGPPARRGSGPSRQFAEKNRRDKGCHNGIDQKQQGHGRPDR